MEGVKDGRSQERECGMMKMAGGWRAENRCVLCVLDAGKVRGKIKGKLHRKRGAGAMGFWRENEEKSE
jgi:hypothetical protein